MDGLTLLAEARAAGLKVKAEGTRLVVRGPREAEPVAKRLLAHKAEVMAALATPGAGRPRYASPWPDALPKLGQRSVGPFTSCEVCRTGSWIRYGGTPLCLLCALRLLDEEEP
jgi:hypothetical protein